jgi:hypothetical protein
MVQLFYMSNVEKCCKYESNYLYGTLPLLAGKEERCFVHSSENISNFKGVLKKSITSSFSSLHIQSFY